MDRGLLLLKIHINKYASIIISILFSTAMLLFSSQILHSSYLILGTLLFEDGNITSVANYILAVLNYKDFDLDFPL